MKYHVRVNKPIHIIEAKDLHDAQRILEDQWNKFRFEICFPSFDFDDLTLEPAGAVSGRPPLPSLPKLPLRKLSRQ